jgi:hypothetical protein
MKRKRQPKARTWIAFFRQEGGSIVVLALAGLLGAIATYALEQMEGHHHVTTAPIEASE